jgi:hypothetical protein
MFHYLYYRTEGIKTWVSFAATSSQLRMAYEPHGTLPELPAAGLHDGGLPVLPQHHCNTASIMYCYILGGFNCELCTVRTKCRVWQTLRIPILITSMQVSDKSEVKQNKKIFLCFEFVGIQCLVPHRKTVFVMIFIKILCWKLSSYF